MKRTNVLILAALLVGSAAAGLRALSFGAVAPDAEAPGDPPKLVVHEWGTFTSFSGADGKNLNFPHKSGDLPSFVYYLQDGNSKSGRGFDIFNPISLETPVLYFYTDRPLTASVSVDFPGGIMTEWYPQAVGDKHPKDERARLAPKRLTWNNIKLMPNAAVSSYDPGDDDGERKPKPGTLALPHDKSDSHYFAARETDAVPLQIKNGTKTEQEKFLFYRGVADFPPPLTVKALGGDRYEVSNRGKQWATGLLLVRIAGGVVRCEKVGNLEGGARKAVTLGDKSATTTDEVGETMVRSLTDAGLYEKEARAMVKTWKADWFADVGTRLLYVAPKTYADELLPLKVEPKPASVVRVLVGRHDIISPEQERALEKSVAELQKLQQEYEALYARMRKIDDGLNQEFGRFKWPAQEAAAARLKNGQK